MNPKRPENYVPYKPPTAETDGSGDFFQLLAFFVGFGSMLMRYKWGIWASLFLLLSAFFNMKKGGEYKHIFMNFMVIIMGLISSYFWSIPPNMAGPPPPSSQPKIETNPGL